MNYASNNFMGFFEVFMSNYCAVGAFHIFNISFGNLGTTFREKAAHSAYDM